MARDSENPCVTRPTSVCRGGAGRLGRFRNDRGTMLLAMYTAVAAFALLLQVFAVRSLTEMRVTNWYRNEAQALRAAEAGLDATYHYFRSTQEGSCLGYDKTDPADTPSAWQIATSACGTQLQTASQTAITALQLLQPGTTYDVKITKGTGVGKKIITIRGYGPTTSSPAVQWIAAAITLIPQGLAQGIVGINSVDLGPDTEINGNVTVFGNAHGTSSGTQALHLGTRAWIHNGKATVGDVSAAFATSPTTAWIQLSASGLDRVVGLDNEAIIGGITNPHDSLKHLVAADPTPDAHCIDCTTAPAANMTTPHVLSPTKYVAYDDANVGQGNDLSGASASMVKTLKTMLADPSQTVGLDCTRDLTVADFATPAPYPTDAGKDGQICFNSLSIGKNALLRFRSPDGLPVRVYVKGLIPGDPANTTMKVGSQSQIYAIDPLGAIIPNGAQIMIANIDKTSNAVHFLSSDAVTIALRGSLFAPYSDVQIDEFDTVTGGTVLADNLHVQKNSSFTVFVGPPPPGGLFSPPSPPRGTVTWTEPPPQH